MKVLISGSRTVNDAQRVSNAISFISTLGNIEAIIHGGCTTGVDDICARICKGLGLNTEVYPAIWSLYGKSAGPRRNRKMVAIADVVIIIPDYADLSLMSKGTKSVHDYAKQTSKLLYMFWNS